MVVAKLFRSIDSMSEKYFENNLLESHLEPNEYYFFKELNNYHNLLNIENGLNFNLSENNHIKLIKTNSNCIQNRVNPQFVKTVKKAILAYLHFLANDWEACEKISHANHANLTRNKHPAHGTVPVWVFSEIANNNGLNKEINIWSNCFGTFVEGEKEKINILFQQIKKEADSEIKDS